MKKVKNNWFRIYIVIITIFFLLSNYSYAMGSFSIAKSCGGGITATDHIYSIDQDGNVSQKVVSYVVKKQNKEEEIIGKINRKDAKELYTDLLQIEFPNIKYRKPHNYSCSLSLTVDGDNHTVIWPGARLPGELKEIKQILDKISKMLDPIIEQNKGKEINK